jgi:hypothetical protein
MQAAKSCQRNVFFSVTTCAVRIPLCVGNRVQALSCLACKFYKLDAPSTEKLQDWSVGSGSAFCSEVFADPRQILLCVWMPNPAIRGILSAEPEKEQSSCPAFPRAQLASPAML